ncbi:MAG: hypothetical protein UHI81_11680 [Olegusella sp.]|nr:hypothetical protein [Olegusella sp.]
MRRQNHKAKGNGKAAEYVKVYRFMTEGMGLQGTLLLVYARIFGFCKETGGSFWESRRGTAEFLGISVRQVNRDMRKLEEMLPSRRSAVQAPRHSQPGRKYGYKIHYSIMGMPPVICRRATPLRFSGFARTRGGGRACSAERTADSRCGSYGATIGKSSNYPYNEYCFSYKCTLNS